MTAQRIIQHIFHQPALSRLSIAELEELVAEYPYFTAARLLLAQKNYEQYPSLHAPAIKKAQLYSNNPHYFFQLVTGELEKAAEAPPVRVESQAFSAYQEPVAEREPEQELPYLLQEREEMRAAQPEPEEPVFTASFTGETTIAETEETEETTIYGQEPPVEETAPAEGSAINDAVSAEEASPSLPDAAFIFGEETPAEAVTEEPAAEEPLTEATENEPIAETFTFSSPEISAEPAPAAAEEAVETPAAAIPVQETVTETPTEAPAPAVHQPAVSAEEPIKIFPLDIPAEETTLTFQPLYTDDYFAYKRLKEPGDAEELNEKGMAEMRSFTDWLREMKDSFVKKADKDWYHQQLHRIYVDDEPEVSEAVEKMAMESITLNDDIVSETLAEIWARQRQYQTAIQIYQKLSLLNPNKSAYFAQKIQELQLQQSETGKN